MDIVQIKVENASALNSDLWRSEKSPFELFCLWNHSWQSNCIHRWAIYIIVLRIYPPTYSPSPTYRPTHALIRLPTILNKSAAWDSIYYWTVRPPFKHESLSPPLPPLPSPSLLFPRHPPFQCCIYFMHTTLYWGRGARDLILMSQGL